MTVDKREGLPVIPSPPLVVERDDGKFQVGIDDETAAGPFDSRAHAESVRLQQSRHDPRWCQ